MFTTDNIKNVGSLGEQKLIEQIKLWLQDAGRPSPEGIGDDCAVLPSLSLAEKLLATTDGVVLNRHFLETDSAELVGRKLLCRNISDIAAMGGEPTQALLVLMLPANLSINWLMQFIKGIKAVCLDYAIVLCGGDITEVPANFFAAYITLLGKATRPVLRTGGRVGDIVAVTGSLGGSINGKHLNFTPRINEGAWLAQQPEVRAMMDLTDGLAKDLPALLPEGAAVKMNTEAILLSPEASSWQQAFSDGEDYELLFVLDAAANWSEFKKEWESHFTLPITVIGTIVAADPAMKSPFIDAATGKELEVPGGYEHLS